MCIRDRADLDHDTGRLTVLVRSQYLPQPLSLGLAPPDINKVQVSLKCPPPNGVALHVRHGGPGPHCDRFLSTQPGHVPTISDRIGLDAIPIRPAGCCPNSCPGHSVR
eukprot:TRINITY_DN22257_c0_g1_i2.p1 TRINITY_DN22257_c0_g1~~TRINITY_DN22257_c0_g1_i2.p1  ORF type:complete len:108 (-),score=10.04 TRINITY_DN22257_c0_g1_i2:343-666(-)